MAGQITFEDRVKIEMLLRQRVKFSDIALQLGVSRATISREISRSLPDNWPNKFKAVRYTAEGAQYRANQRRHSRDNYTKRTKKHETYIRKRILEDKWSPEQIVYGTKGFDISPHTIYTWINYNKIPGVSNSDLRHKGKRYKRAMNKRIRDSYHQNKSDNREAVKKHTIEHRPAAIDNRNRMGHWELDGVESRKSNAMILTFVERKTRYAVAIKIPSKHAEDIKLGIDTFMSQYQPYVKSITCDRGSEFMAYSTQLAFHAYKIKYYYAHAYSPYERGSNENFNALLRGYFPKGTDFNKVTQQELSDAVTAINKRPMRLHRFKSRLSAFERHVSYLNRHQKAS
ncbi:Transposase [Fructilactobacillus florum 8D]|uniref:Transposase n=1 Tax=Fructilactobacillus florum 8D TaxID=1221538 RepID=W9EEW2_9LACO|nr:IS30 family transposase [Fructilactobacillus florum]EKK21193.1 Transposase [Fructilactobacillus florum 2F]ETO40617.1 Transposase [Fructilactobacillus florum 8D]